MDEDGDDNDDMEGNADVADMMMGGNQSDDDIEDFAELGGGDKGDFDNPQNQMISSAIPREDWMLEVERVAHKLKIGNVLGSDGVKEWRNHLDQTKKYADQVRSSLPDVRVKLERLSDDVSRVLERISKKEGLLSKSF